MSFANIIGQFLQQGLSEQSRSRLNQALGSLELDGAGGKLEQFLGNLLNGNNDSGSGRGSAPATSSSGGGFLNLIRGFFGSKQTENLTGGQLTGIGALAGALLGGGAKASKGALGGSAMAILGSLALNALKGRLAASGTPASEGNIDRYAMEAIDDPDTQRLIVRAMIAAARADGTIDEQENARILGKVGEDGVTEAERQLVEEELRRPADMAALAAAVSNQVVAAEVYSASLLAINVDTEKEEDYLRELAKLLGLDAATVARLHKLTGAPEIS